MSAKIQQLHLLYQPIQDRLLMRISTSNGDEYSFWLTRRFVQLLWPVLKNILESDLQISSHSDVLAKRDILLFQHEKATSQAKFTKKYVSKAQHQPLGQLPLLLTTLEAKGTDRDTTSLQLKTSDGGTINVMLDSKLTHAVCKLLADTVEKAKWDLNLQLVDLAQPITTAGHVLN